MKNILIAVSGTGGHVYPGIALAYELKKAGYNPVFIVNNNKNGVSLKIVSTSGYDYEILDFKAPPRKISLDLFLFPFKFIKTLFSVKKILNHKKFDYSKINNSVRLNALKLFELQRNVANYYNLPIIICERLFKVLDTKGNTSLSQEDFVTGLINLFLGDYKTLIKMATQFLDDNWYLSHIRHQNNTVYTLHPLQQAF